MNTSGRQTVTGSQLLWLGAFGIAMGLLEAIVVVYLRALYFPAGFGFPLRMLPEHMLRLEVVREFSTLVMLAAVAAIVSKKPFLRLAVFLISFGIWDLFYYFFLKVFLDWPPSFFTWDVLFLIPITWLGPVLAPVICSLTMIGLGFVFLRFDRTRENARIGQTGWIFLSSGAALIFLSFVLDTAGIIMRGGFLRDIAHLPGNTAFLAAMASFVPARFRWDLFFGGELLVVLSALAVYRESSKNRNPSARS